MTINTERLYIRPIVEGDWRSVQSIWEDFSHSKYAQYDRPHDLQAEDVRARMAKWEKANHETDHMFFAVCLHDIVIGYIAFNKRKNGYEVGYCFHSTYFGNGYAKESHLALFNYLQTLGITRLTAGTAIKNIPSVELLKSLGFQQIDKEKVSFYSDTNGNAIVFDGGIFELTLKKKKQ